MAIDPLANIVDRLRSCGFQPRKVGDDAWELRCPGHGGNELALFLGRDRDGKLVLQCRSTQKCSFSSVLKKLNLKLRHLNRDTSESVIRRLRAMEVQLGLYPHPVPLVADAVVLTMPAAATVPDAAAQAEDEDMTAVTLAVTAPECNDYTNPSNKNEPETEETYPFPRIDAVVEEREAIDILNGSVQESPSPAIAAVGPGVDSEPGARLGRFLARDEERHRENPCDRKTAAARGKCSDVPPAGWPVFRGGCRQRPSRVSCAGIARGRALADAALLRVNWAVAIGGIIIGDNPRH